MEKTVYADVLFLINFCLDFLSLFAAAKLTCSKAKLARLILASAAGGVYSVLCALFDIPLFIHILFPALMCAIGFCPMNILSFAKLFIAFYGACAVFGGSMSAINNIATQHQRAPLQSYPLLFFLLSFSGIFLSSFVFKSASKYFSSKTVQVRVYFGKESFELLLFCDTGNNLRCPYSALPVIIVKKSAAKNLPCLESEEGKQLCLENKMRYIPVKTVSGSSLLPAYRPEKILLKYKKGTKEIEALVAIDERDEDYFGTDGLFPHCLNV